MRAYFDARYASDNTVVALAGRLDFDAACRLIEQRCGSWKATRVTRDNRPPPVHGGDFSMTKANVSRGYLLAIGAAPAIADDRRYAAGLLAQVLGAPDNSRLHWALVEPGLAEDAQASFDPHDGFGEFFIFTSAEPARLDEVWRTARREAAAVLADLSAGDLDRLRTKALTAATIGGERPHDRMHRLGRTWTYLGTYTTLEEELARLGRVTLDDVRAVHDAFPYEPATVGRLLPG
jgi:predicted Zn-dependent peptidase